MRGVLLEVPQALLDERRRTGMDRFDELWDGEWHLVPTASTAHGRLGRELFKVLEPAAERLGLEGFFDGTGLYRTPEDYRVPDQQCLRPEVVTHRGTSRGADLVVELRSPDDESYVKLDWYAAMDVREMLVIDVETRVPRVFAGIDRQPMLAQPDDTGAVRSTVLGVTFAPVPGPRLRVVSALGVAEL